MIATAEGIADLRQAVIGQFLRQGHRVLQVSKNQSLPLKTQSLQAKPMLSELD